MRVKDVENDKELTYRIVGELEADIKKRLISVTSPLARGLIGKQKGDLAMVQSPGGAREYEVKAISFDGMAWAFQCAKKRISSAVTLRPFSVRNR